MAYPATNIPNRTAGEFIDDVDWDELVDALNFLANRPAVSLTHSGAQSIPNITETIITFDVEELDTDSMHSTVTNTGRITFNTPGIYAITGLVTYVSGGSSGSREAFIRKNATGAYLAMANQVSNSGSYLSVAAIAKFAAADFVELRAFQSSGGALNTFFSSPTIGCRFAATWLGKG